MDTVIIADNQSISNAGWQFFLKRYPQFEHLFEAGDKSALARLLPVYPTSIVILDYTMFNFVAVEDLTNMIYRYPSSHWILFSEELSNEFVKHIYYQTVNTSLLFKDASSEEILTALSMAGKSERFFGSRVVAQLLGKQSQVIEPQEMALTPSEREILRLIALGKSTKEIAQDRFSSVHTITTHRKNIFRKLEINSVYEATRYALRAGIIDAADYYI